MFIEFNHLIHFWKISDKFELSIRILYWVADNIADFAVTRWPALCLLSHPNLQITKVQVTILWNDVSVSILQEMWLTKQQKKTIDGHQYNFLIILLKFTLLLLVSKNKIFKWIIFVIGSVLNLTKISLILKKAGNFQI